MEDFCFICNECFFNDFIFKCINYNFYIFLNLNWKWKSTMKLNDTFIKKYIYVIDVDQVFFY